ncbi:Coiled-coil domain-containing protein 50 [Sarcoptes scabiei]|uniref:Coiled-coil domain-containing protein 50 n=1 Tax=Sarcoptes scabiei TaxID=52283 RepID=A0A834R6U4_SARSC|nr:Coiled-coil domain-containing protein 50 [Sarcoptes scabiei]
MESSQENGGVLSTSSTNEEVKSTIPEGRVGQVCREWLIREDGNLAYRLQNEEIAQHYNENRSKNQLVRQDLPLARHLQHNEIVEAQKKYELYLQEQLDHDEMMARNIERKLWMEEEAAKRATEEADERLAKKLMEKEKAKQLKKRLAREKKQVEKLSAQIGADYPLDTNTTNYQNTMDSGSKRISHRIMTEDERELDLSEFCMPPPPGLTPDELKAFLEEQDAEIAQLLQHQEWKRNRNPTKEKLAMIEQQDFEIAKMLQKIEKERFKRIKERMRNGPKRTSIELTNQIDTPFRASTPISPTTESNEASEQNLYDIPENNLVNEHDVTYEEPLQVLLNHDRTHQSNLVQGFHNIAIDLDPTYKRRSMFYSTSRRSPNEILESCVDDSYDQFNPISILSSSSDFTGSVSVQKNGNLVERRHSLDIDHEERTSKSIKPIEINVCATGLRRNFNEDPISMIPSSSSSPPPLPPRDHSLHQNREYDFKMPTLAQFKEKATKNSPIFSNQNLLPPHHPQHPNRILNDSLSNSTSSSFFHSNQNNSPFVQGQRRIMMNAFAEKPRKSKHKSQETCQSQ